jgi:hypothetical protein
MEELNASTASALALNAKTSAVDTFVVFLQTVLPTLIVPTT